MTKFLTNTANASSPLTPDEALRSLSHECAFPVPVDLVSVRQTHISTVFLGGELVFKVKKPVKLPFLDFSTIEKRHFFCHEEVRINRPWAPDVYLGVVPVTRDANGLRFEGSGPVVDWAVKMRRLPESANLRSRLTHGLLEPRDLVRAAQRIAAIHRQACCCVGEQATQAESEFRRRLCENWEFARGLKPQIIEPHVLQRLETLSEEWLQRHGETLRRRASDGHLRDLHGDLRLEHIFLFPDRSPPNDVVILDGIEFDSGLRRIDVLADIAFSVMELSFVGRRDLARVFADVYFSETRDEGRELLPLFSAYRSAVRAKVAAILGSEPEIPHPDRDQALARSQAHWLWSLSELERPDRRPALVLVSGLPGTGKSTLARSLADVAHFDEVLRSDVIRKELAHGWQALKPCEGRGEAAIEQSRPSMTQGVPLSDLYTPDFTERTYDECWCRARKRLLAGGRVLVDATFQRESFRRRFLQLAIDCGVRAVWLECVAPSETVQQRLFARHDDASDADWPVYQLVQSHWEEASEFCARHYAAIEAGGSAASALDAARGVLRAQGLVE